MSHTISGVKFKTKPQLLALQKTRMPRQFSQHPHKGLRYGVTSSMSEVTLRNPDISALLRITQNRKILSRMNPLNETGVSAIIRRGNPG